MSTTLHLVAIMTQGPCYTTYHLVPITPDVASLSGFHLVHNICYIGVYLCFHIFSGHYINVGLCTHDGIVRECEVIDVTRSRQTVPNQ